jgi:hypothetical protein
MGAGGGGLKFAEGGLIPGAPSGRDNRLAAVASGEYVVRSSAVSHYGAGFFESLNAMRFPRQDVGGYPVPLPSSAMAFASGGLVGGGAGAAEMGVSIAVLNTREDQREFMRREGKKYVVDIVKGTSWQLGI